MEIIIEIALLILLFISVFGLAANTGIAIEKSMVDKKLPFIFKLMVFVGSVPLFVVYVLGAVTIADSTKPVSNTIEYKQGYQDALDTKFEQRIDTVYYRKK